LCLGTMATHSAILSNKIKSSDLIIMRKGLRKVISRG